MAANDDRDLQRYFDGELSPRQARRVYERLQQSPEDRDRLAALGEMRGMLREAHADVVEEPSFDQLWTRVEAGIEEQRPLPLAERVQAWMRRHGLILAPVAAAVVVLVMLLGPADEPSVARNDCEIESLEVGQDSVSTIFTIDDPEETGETTVIWLSSAEDFSGGDDR